MDDKLNQMFEMLRSFITPTAIVTTDEKETDESVNTIKQMIIDSNE